MTIFAVWQDDLSGPDGALADAIDQSGLQKYVLDENNWLISFSGTARELSDRLGISDGERGSGVVTEVASYSGRANPAVWTWIKVQWEGRAVG